MNMIRFIRRFSVTLSILAFAALSAYSQIGSTPKLERDPNVAIDAEYTKKIAEYTTKKEFNSPLTNYLPASDTVPTPKDSLGYIAGAPGNLPYSHEVYKYMRMVENVSPRVKVYSIGKNHICGV